MERLVFSDADRRQMEALGLSETHVRTQIEIFRKSSCCIRLSKPCTLHDGVQRVPPAETESYLKLHEGAARTGRFRKFVPASGAATRMFQSLLQIYYMPQYLEHEELHLRAEQGVTVACDFLEFLNGLPRFAFLQDLEGVLARDGFSLDGLIAQRHYRLILDYLLTEKGLSYGKLPKGLLKFHRYPAGCRTAFEEHLAESVHYLARGDCPCSIHFTISPEHHEGFQQLAEALLTRYLHTHGVRHEVDFSFQKRSTDTIAVDLKNRPFRDRSGHLHFRPGGHGALLENLNDLQGDLVYIKNVDNLVPDHRKEVIAYWKRILGGYLVEIEERVHAFIRRMRHGVSQGLVDEVVKFCRERLLIRFSRSFGAWPLELKHEFLLAKLDRPIRVCGVVENIGEPGGAPFWVKDHSGVLSIQIVEKAQVDFTQTEQEEIWMASTHFNPVDIVCSLRDYEGRPFDLRRFVDPDAVFITTKSKDGQEIKALELPGLWNGAMADWITVVVEVPRVTFNPVKTLYDLLKPEHQLGDEELPKPTHP